VCLPGKFDKTLMVVEWLGVEKTTSSVRKNSGGGLLTELRWPTEEEIYKGGYRSGRVAPAF